MTVYPDMNNKIVDLLRMGDTPVELYAAQRIEELELKNKELIDRVLEIIDNTKQAFIEDGIEGEAVAVEHAIDRIKELQSEVLTLQRGKE